jgi:hypothetical protein
VKERICRTAAIKIRLNMMTCIVFSSNQKQHCADDSGLEFEIDSVLTKLWLMSHGCYCKVITLSHRGGYDESSINYLA